MTVEFKLSKVDENQERRYVFCATGPNRGSSYFSLTMPELIQLMEAGESIIHDDLNEYLDGKVDTGD